MRQHTDRQMQRSLCLQDRRQRSSCDKYRRSTICRRHARLSDQDGRASPKCHRPSNLRRKHAKRRVRPRLRRLHREMDRYFFGVSFDLSFFGFLVSFFWVLFPLAMTSSSTARTFRHPRDDATARDAPILCDATRHECTGQGTQRRSRQNSAILNESRAHALRWRLQSNRPRLRLLVD